MSSRSTVEGVQRQGVNEKICYRIDVSNWSKTPTNATVIALTDAEGTDVTATVMPSGTPVVTGYWIKLPILKSLTADTLYRVNLRFDAEGNTFECYFFVKAEL